MDQKTKYISWESVEEYNKEHSEDVDDMDEFDDYEDVSSFNDNPIMQSFQALSGSRPKLIYTPAGPVNGNDPWNPINRYELYVGHTYGFKVTSDFYLKVANVEGVDLVRPISPHSFMIGPARCYDWSEVRVGIEKIIGCHKDVLDRIADPKIQSEAKKLKTQLESTGRPYFLYVLPNGRMVYKTADQEEFMSVLSAVEESLSETPKAILIKNEC